MTLFQKKVKDERVEQLKSRICGEIYGLIVIGCTISLMIKTFVYSLSLRETAVELSILILGSVYYTIRAARLGILSEEAEQNDRKSKWSTRKKGIWFTLGLTFFMALFIAGRNALLYADSTRQAVYFFCLILLVCLMIWIPIFLTLYFVSYEGSVAYSRKRSKQNVDDDDEKS